MSDKSNEGASISAGVWVGLGLGAGALLGLAVAWQASQNRHAEIVESVDELRERTHRVLNELSESVSGLLDQTRSQVGHAAEALGETLDETIVHGAEA